MAELDYASLLNFRTALRRFNRWSEEQAAAVGLTHAQHQVLLAIKGHEDRRGPTIGEIADYLLIRHHSAAELVGRTEVLGFIKRRKDDDDSRVVRITLTKNGEASIRALTTLHLSELRALDPTLRPVLDEPPPAKR